MTFKFIKPGRLFNLLTSYNPPVILGTYMILRILDTKPVQYGNGVTHYGVEIVQLSGYSAMRILKTEIPDTNNNNVIIVYL
jgi:hypothetical protein